ncbi:hypothetical protein CASFOL_030010 [Castilleja foliolosa]|uniref:Uncharacterized protein n=1 Tax=Castilleja foliolosa TaxID=1961234 RepID=A0ABD3CAV6_9LAMI
MGVIVEGVKEIVVFFALMHSLYCSSRRVMIDMPTIEVRFEHLNVDVEGYSANGAFHTLVNFNINT